MHLEPQRVLETAPDLQRIREMGAVSSERTEHEVRCGVTRRVQPSVDSFLNWLGIGIAGFGHVRRLVREGFSRFVGALFMLRTHFADRIMPAIIPCDADFAVNHNPGAISRSYRFLG